MFVDFISSWVSGLLDLDLAMKETVLVLRRLQESINTLTSFGYYWYLDFYWIELVLRLLLDYISTCNLSVMQGG